MGAISEGRNLLDYPTAAVRLGLKESKLRDLVHKRQIPFVKLPPGGRTSPVRFDPAALDKWLAANTVPVGCFT